MLVPIGTFNEGRKVSSGRGFPKEYPSLTVTRERADGNQASSGEKVLVGTAALTADGARDLNATVTAPESGQPSTRRTTSWRARYRRLITVPSGMRRARAASL